MLPAEALADVASFLGYYDLGGLKFANKTLSAVASKCAGAIRVFDFSGYVFFVQDSDVNVHELDTDGDAGDWVCELELATERDLADFVSAAFRNCTVGRLVLMSNRDRVQTAIKGVANTVVIACTLEVAVGSFENTHDFFEFVESFRGIKVWSRAGTDSFIHKGA